MTALNAVRFRVKLGRDQEFLDAHKTIEATWPGLIHANIIKTGDRSYCIIAEWKESWPRLSEQILRVVKWSLCRD